MGLGIDPGLGADEQAVAGTHHAMAVGAQFEALAPGVFASGVVFDAGDRTEAQAGALMVARAVAADRGAAALVADFDPLGLGQGVGHELTGGGAGPASGSTGLQMGRGGGRAGRGAGRR